MVNSELCVNCLALASRASICEDCYNDLPWIGDACYQCGLPLPYEADHCGECLSAPPSFSHSEIPLLYTYPANRMLHRYKYHRRLAYGRALLQPLLAVLRTHLSVFPGHRPDLLIPCPMHRSRERQRGFNHADDLAERLSVELTIPWSNRALRRIRATEAQVGLDRRRRTKNLRSAFEVCSALPARIALVDDVMTTGATARALSSLLLEHGAEDVQIWAIARTPSQTGTLASTLNEVIDF